MGRPWLLGFCAQGGGYLIPDSISKRWIRTDPKKHIEFWANANKSHNGNLVPLLFPGQKVWACFYGLTVSILDTAFLEHFQKAIKQKAAKIQELFDCDVLGMEWPSVKAGSRVDSETILEASKTYKKRDPLMAQVKDWYPASVANLPVEFARLVCQRANCRWDMELRNRCGKCVLGLFAVLFIVVFLIGLASGLTLETFVLAILAPLSPAFLWSVREYRKQLEAAESLRRLKEHIERVWTEALSKKLQHQRVSQETREIQDEIYNRRQNNPLIFDWVYNLSRAKRGAEMIQGTDYLVEEALRTLQQAPSATP